MYIALTPSQTNDLIGAARAGDLKARDRLLSPFYLADNSVLRLARRRYSHIFAESDPRLREVDLRQAIWFAGVDAIATFDASLGASFATRLWQCLRGRLTQIKRCGARTSIPIPLPTMNEDAEEMGDPADYIPAAYRDDDWAILCDQLLAPLPDIERRVFIAREKEGKTFAEIGAEFNCTDEWARKKYHRARIWT